ncbi:Heterogeneous nuclear ribonucleoprotein K [Trachymyrmex cornetzi]|uniref:Heterogeneous nuclear ribonucleoprotein K n=1 Tax=Trachymyrmex cornetzi TaxID=471704 RepID=A0A195DZ85_9HYME|nr:Heterogeneous nuclear ribonucleoprotein K [Trachymyrmex cornetzi]
MKREAEAGAMTGSGGPTSPHKRYRQGDDELRLLIPSKVAGSIIGKGGQNITKLRSQYKASIIVPDCPGPERVLTISSDLPTVLQVLNEVVPNLEEKALYLRSKKYRCGFDTMGVCGSGSRRSILSAIDVAHSKFPRLIVIKDDITRFLGVFLAKQLTQFRGILLRLYNFA